MSDKKYVVPDGMLKAAAAASGGVDPEGCFLYLPLEAAVRWLAENPIVASEKVISEISLKMGRATSGAINEMLQEWQRRMFLAHPETPSCDQQKIWTIECQNINNEWIEYNSVKRTLAEAIAHMKRIKLSRELRDWPLRVVSNPGVEWERRMSGALDMFDPDVMYIMRHFDDLGMDEETLRNRAEAAVSDAKEHRKRNGG